MSDVTKLSDSQLEAIIKSYAVFTATEEESRNFVAAYREREIRKKIEKRVEADQRREARERYTKGVNDDVEGRLAMMGH
jgi:uncharacterized membrane protein YqiK